MSNPQTPDNTGTPNPGLALPLDPNDSASSGFAAAAQAALGNVAFNAAAVTPTTAAAGAAPANANTAAQGAGAQPPGNAARPPAGGGNKGNGGAQGGNPNRQQTQQPGGGGGNRPQTNRNRPQTNRQSQTVDLDNSWDSIDPNAMNAYDASLRDHVKALVERPDGMEALRALSDALEGMRVNVTNMQLAVGDNVKEQIKVGQKLDATIAKLAEVLAAHNPARIDAVLANINDRLGKAPTADNFNDLVKQLTEAIEKGFEKMSTPKQEPAHGAGGHGHDAGHGGAHAPAEAKTDKKKEEEKKITFWHIVGAVVLGILIFVFLYFFGGLAWDGAATRFGNFLRGNTGVSSPTPIFLPTQVPTAVPTVPSAPPAPPTLEERVQNCARGLGGGAEAEADCRETIK